LLVAFLPADFLAAVFCLAVVVERLVFGVVVRFRCGPGSRSPSRLLFHTRPERVAISSIV
jgi:hypothetical protein